MSECVTHHFACACREAMVKQMCEYLLWAVDAEGTTLRGYTSAVDAAAALARELYPDKEDEE